MGELLMGGTGANAAWCWRVSVLWGAPQQGGACPEGVMAVGRSPPQPGLWAPSQVPFHRLPVFQSIICNPPGRWCLIRA